MMFERKIAMLHIQCHKYVGKSKKKDKRQIFRRIMSNLKRILIKLLNDSTQKTLSNSRSTFFFFCHLLLELTAKKRVKGC